MCQCKISPTGWNRVCAVVEMLRRSMGAFAPAVARRGRVRWLGLDWVGLPMPLRWAWGVLRLLMTRECGGAPAKPGNGTGAGCGCVYRLKVWKQWGVRRVRVAKASRSGNQRNWSPQ